MFDQALPPILPLSFDIGADPDLYLGSIHLFLFLRILLLLLS